MRKEIHFSVERLIVSLAKKDYYSNKKYKVVIFTTLKWQGMFYFLSEICMKTTTELLTAKN
jgi:hypothetical protein